MRRRLTPGTWGWIGLAAYVVLWDNLAPETLSAAYEKALGRRKGLVLVASWVVVSHLLVKTPLPIRVMRRG